MRDDIHRSDDGGDVEVGTGVSTAATPFQAGRAAASEAARSVRRHAMSLVVVFASVRHDDLEAVIRGVRTVTGSAPLVGGTTAGEICDGEHGGSVVVSVIASPFVRARIGVGEAVSADWRRALDSALDAPGVTPYFEQEAAPWATLTSSGANAFALLFSPGNTRDAVSRSSDLLEAVKRRSLGRLPVFGGSAADDWRMDANFVFAGDRVVRDGLVVAIVETELQFGIALAHGLRADGARVTVTEAREHEVLSLDGRPAAEAYAKLLGHDAAELAGKHVSLHTGRLVGTADLLGTFVPNVASYFTARGGVLFTRAVSAGTELCALVPDALACRGAALEAVRKATLRAGTTEPAIALLTYCALRPKVLGDLDEIAHLRRALPQLPVVGFRSFGEQAPSDDGVVRHTNAVVAALVLGRKLSYAARVGRENDALRRQAEHRTVELARAHDQLGRAHEDLERAVDERTRELVAVNEALRLEIEERKRLEALAQRHLRALRTLTSCNEALVRATSEPALLETVCRSVVEAGGYRMCWVGYAEHDERKTVRPVAQRGFDDGYLENIDVVWDDSERGRGPVGTAIRTGHPVVVHDVLADPSFAPWRDRARARGFRSMAALPLVAEGGVLGGFAIYAAETNAFTDESELRLLGDLAGDLAYGIAALRARAERAQMAVRMMQTDRLAAVGTLAAGVAHEINNPLTYVVAGAQFARQSVAAELADLDADELREVLDEVCEGADRIRQIVADLRTFSRAEDAKATRVDLRRVLDVAAKMTSNETRHRARLVRRYGDVAPVVASEGRLVQVFVNLLINAAHAIAERGVDENEIVLTTSTDERGAVVAEVQDTGAGIDPAVLDRIFEPFFTTKPMGVGTGLGLSICRNIIVSFGGDISVASERGVGTRFRVTLPAANTAVDAASSSDRAPARDALRGRVLVVDDEENVLRAIRRALQDHHEVVCASGAREALGRIERGERFDVLLCDLMMPGMSGIELHHAIARHDFEQAGRVVFVSGGAVTPAAKEFLATTRQPRVEKPFTPAALHAAIEAVMMARAG